MAEDALKTSQAALWIQPDGPNTEKFFLGCHDLDDISAPEGGTELIRKFKPDGTGWEVTTTKKAPPDPVTTTVTTLLFKQRDWIEKIKNCPFVLYILFRECGRADVFNNFVRGLILQSARISGRTYGQAVRREEDLESTVAAEIEAKPPMLNALDLTVERIPSVEVQALNDVAYNRQARCYGPCGATLDPGDQAYVFADSSGAATPNSYYSNDEGQTWTIFPTDPAFGNFHIMAGVRAQMDRNTIRIIVGREGLGGALQGQMAYTDNFGTAWTIANVGGAGAQHGPVYGGGLWVQDQYLWLASSLGYIYVSRDYGETWVAMSPGTLTVQNLNAIHFCDNMNGMAVGLTGVCLKTVDGGLTWAAMTVPAVQTSYTVQMIDAKRAWVGQGAGGLWYTADGGVTWTQRTGWTGSGAGSVRSLSFLNELIGFMAYNTAGVVGSVLRTIDGGHEWQVLTTPTNSGLNQIAAIREDLAYAVGEPNGGTAVFLKIRAS
jgi:photosystem II stability/assembly factor-like uncharacterized protein